MGSVFDTKRYQELNAISMEEFAALPESEQRAIGREMAAQFSEELTEDEVTERLALFREALELDPPRREEFVSKLSDREIGD
jgi:hypothetical protein